MKNNPLKIALVLKWHLPFFRDLDNNYLFPNNRIKIINDFYGFILVSEKYPDIPFNICLSPSTFMQIKDFAEKKSGDPFFDFLNTRPELLSREEKHNLLNEIFSYQAICSGRVISDKGEDFVGITTKTPSQKDKLTFVDMFSDEKYREIQFKLLVNHLNYLFAFDPGMSKIVGKKGKISAKAFAELLDYLNTIFHKIIDFLMSLKENENRSISTTAFYHALLPIVVDSRIAVKVTQKNVRESISNIDKIPAISLKEDAEWQINASLKYLKEELGIKPKGFVLPEGAVSEEVLELLGKNYNYTFIEESILRDSEGSKFDNQKYTYLPWQIKTGTKNVSIFVVDEALEEKLHSVYPTLGKKQIEKDLLSHFQGILQRITSSGRDLSNSLVTIIIRPDSFHSGSTTCLEILDLLFGMLDSRPYLRATTHDNYLDQYSHIKELKHIKPNTRYLDSFQTWIGEPGKNNLWELLLETRTFLEKKEIEQRFSKAKLQTAFHLLQQAESSDWWLYLGEYPPYYARKIKTLFIEILRKIYTLFTEKAPAAFKGMETQKLPEGFIFHPVKGLISPTIDGVEYPATEWQNAIQFHALAQDSDYGSDNFFKDVYVGFDSKNIYLKIEFVRKPPLFSEFIFSFYLDKKMVVVCSPFRGIVTVTQLKDDEVQVWDTEYLKTEMEFVDQFEVALPQEKIRIKKGKSIRFQITLKKNRQEIARFPKKGLLDLDLSMKRQVT